MVTVPVGALENPAVEKGFVTSIVPLPGATFELLTVAGFVSNAAVLCKEAPVANCLARI